MGRKVSTQAVPDFLADLRRIDLATVAATIGITKHYLWQCLQASRDEKLRKKYKISRSTLATYPLKDWFQQGRTWMIMEKDFRRQHPH